LVVGLVYFFVLYDHCIVNTAIICEVVVTSIVFSATSAADKIERGSLFISSVLTLDCLLLILSALAETADQCNGLAVYDLLRNIVVIFLASVFSLIAVGYSSLHYFVALRKFAKKRNVYSRDYAGSNSNGLVYVGRGHGHGHPHHYGNIQPEDPPTTRYSSSGSVIVSIRENLIGTTKKPYSFTKFHLVFTFAGMYLGMAFSRKDSTVGPDSHILLWIIVSVQGITVLLYIWSLIAPLFIEKLQVPQTEGKALIVEAIPDLTTDTV